MECSNSLLILGTALWYLWYWCVWLTHVFSHFVLRKLRELKCTGAPTYLCSLSMWPPWLILCWPQIGVYLGTWLLVIDQSLMKLLTAIISSITPDEKWSEQKVSISNCIFVNFCGRIIAVRCSFVKRSFPYRICMIEIWLYYSFSCSVKRTTYGKECAGDARLIPKGVRQSSPFFVFSPRFYSNVEC